MCNTDRHNLSDKTGKELNSLQNILECAFQIWVAVYKNHGKNRHNLFKKSEQTHVIATSHTVRHKSMRLAGGRVFSALRLVWPSSPIFWARHLLFLLPPSAVHITFIHLFFFIFYFLSSGLQTVPFIVARQTFAIKCMVSDASCYNLHRYRHLQAWQQHSKARPNGPKIRLVQSKTSSSHPPTRHNLY